MAQDFKDVVQQNLSKIKESSELATDFIKNALLTGWTDSDITRGLLLNGITKEEIIGYLSDGHKKLEQVLGG